MAIVMKFGGTSVGSSLSINNVFEIVMSRLQKNPIVVVSAITKVTDMLLQKTKDAEKGDVDISEIEKRHFTIMDELGMDHSVISEELDGLKNSLSAIAKNGLNKKMLDNAASFGERMSSKIVAAYLTKKGIPARAVFAYDIGFVTDSNFTDAELDDVTYDNLKKNPLLNEKGIVNVVTGFIAKDHKGSITTLGRGGSDFTAAIIGAAVNAELVEIWTDVDGIMTADPRIVSNAKSIEEISFSEAAELAYFGAKVLHPKTLLPAMDKNIPVAVLNTHNPSHKGTTIRRKSVIGDVFKAISSKKNVSTIRIVSSRMLGSHGFLARLFQIFNKHKIAIDMIATSEVSVSVTAETQENLNYLAEDLE
ncbi:MAG: aspartate kinase, partial [Candidatus Woesearchaeota archaeon]|nr:aspartate kinase [Candidatus Woesearchaeota archaeon]